MVTKEKLMFNGMLVCFVEWIKRCQSVHQKFLKHFASSFSHLCYALFSGIKLWLMTQHFLSWWWRTCLISVGDSLHIWRKDFVIKFKMFLLGIFTISSSSFSVISLANRDRKDFHWLFFFKFFFWFLTACCWLMRSTCWLLPKKTIFCAYFPNSSLSLLVLWMSEQMQWKLLNRCLLSTFFWSSFWKMIILTAKSAESTTLSAFWHGHVFIARFN